MLLWVALVAGSLPSLVFSVNADHQEDQYRAVSQNLTHLPAGASANNSRSNTRATTASLRPEGDSVLSSSGTSTRSLPPHGYASRETASGTGRDGPRTRYNNADTVVVSSIVGTATSVRPSVNVSGGQWSANFSTTADSSRSSSLLQSSSDINGTFRSPQSANATQHANSTVASVCGGCTVSPMGATLAWWYPTSLYHGFSSLKTTSNEESTGFEVVPASTTFDLDGALKQETWLMSTTFDTLYNTSGVDFIASTLNPPVAAATSEIYVTAVHPLPRSQIISPSQIADAYLDPIPMASVSFAGAANKTGLIIASGTPYLLIPAYAMLTASKAPNGQCRLRSTRYNLSQPYYGAYVGSGDPSDRTSIRESFLPQEFLSLIPETHARCDPLLVAQIEMLVIVTLIYDVGLSPFFAHVESSVTETAERATPTANVLTTSTILTSGEAVVVVCGGVRCFPIIAIAHHESTVTGPLDGPGAVTRVIAPIATSTGKNGDSVTIFGQVPGDDGNGDNNGGDGSQGGGPTNSGGGASHDDDGRNNPSTGGSSTHGGSSSGKHGGSSSGGGPDHDSDSGGTSEGSGGLGHPAMIPLVAHVESTLPVTFFVSASRAITEVTVSFQGQTLVATAQPTGSPNPTVAGLVAVIQGVGSGRANPTPTEHGHSDGQDNSGSRAEGEPSRSADGTTADNPVLTIGVETFTANAQGQFSFNEGTTLSPGGSVDFHGTKVVLAQGGSIAVVNGITQTLQVTKTTPPPLLTIGTQTFVGNAATQYYLDQGATLTPGGLAVFHGSSISLDASAQHVVINGKTTEVNGPQNTPPPILLVDGTSYTADAGSTYYVDGQRLTPGGDIKVSGTTISLVSDAKYLVLDGVTITRPPRSGPSYPVLRVGEAAINPQPAPGLPGVSEYIINGETLLPGGSALTVSGTTLSLLPSGAGLVANGLTSTFTSTTGVVTSAPILTIDGRTYPPLPGGGTSYNVDGETLTPGGVITVHEETISLASSATVLVVDGKTVTLFPATGTATLTSTARGSAAQAGGSSSTTVASSANNNRGLQSAASHPRRCCAFLIAAALTAAVAVAW